MRTVRPNLISAYTIAGGHYNRVEHLLKDGTWCPARPVGAPKFIQRLTWAWRVFTGRYDALIWPGQEE